MALLWASWKLSEKIKKDSLNFGAVYTYQTKVLFFQCTVQSNNFWLSWWFTTVLRPTLLYGAESWVRNQEVDQESWNVKWGSFEQILCCAPVVEEYIFKRTTRQTLRGSERGSNASKASNGSLWKAGGGWIPLGRWYWFRQTLTVNRDGWRRLVHGKEVGVGV